MAGSSLARSRRASRQRPTGLRSTIPYSGSDPEHIALRHPLFDEIADLVENTLALTLARHLEARSHLGFQGHRFPVEIPRSCARKPKPRTRMPPRKPRLTNCTATICRDARRITIRRQKQLSQMESRAKTTSATHWSNDPGGVRAPFDKHAGFASLAHVPPPTAACRGGEFEK